MSWSRGRSVATNSVTDVTIGGPGTIDDVSIELREKGRSVVSSEAAPPDNGYGIESGMGLKREKLNLPVVTDSHPARSRAQIKGQMRLQAKMFLVWGGFATVLLTGASLAVQHTLEANFTNLSSQALFATRQSVHAMQEERVKRMREASSLVMNSPELLPP